MSTSPDILDVAVVGANGYTGGELLRYLAGHPRVRVAAATSRSLAGESIAASFPSLAGVAGLPVRFEDLDAAAVAERAPVAFACLPHGQAHAWVGRLRDAGRTVIDLSADYRYADQAVYETNYGEHSRPDLLGEAVYGLPEWNREAVAGADLIANPGCYPTSVLLGLLPMLAADWIAGPVIADCQSGVTGAGRSPKLRTLHAEVSEGMTAYGLPKHRHSSEMAHQGRRIGGREFRLLFTPHLAPVNRGILSTLHVPLPEHADLEAIRRRYERCYGDEPFVTLLPEGQIPRTAAVRGTNRVHIQLVPRELNLLTVLVAIDNLGKGAAGQAVQNLNLRMDWPEAEGLGPIGLLP